MKTAKQIKTLLEERIEAYKSLLNKYEKDLYEMKEEGEKGFLVEKKERKIMILVDIKNELADFKRDIERI